MKQSFHSSSISRHRAAFTLIELLVVIGIIAVLIAMLIPMINRAREQANTAVCLMNLKQIAGGFAMYINDSKGYIPPVGYRSLTATPPGYVAPTSYHTWFTIFVDKKYITAPLQADPLSPHSSGNSVLRCPTVLDMDANFFVFANFRGLLYVGGTNGYQRATSPDTGAVIDCYYGANGSTNQSAFPMPRIPQDDGASTAFPGKYNALWKVTQVSHPSDTWLIADGHMWHNRTSRVWAAYPRHGKDAKLANFLFVDGHAETIDTTGWSAITSLPVVPSQWNAEYDALTNNTSFPRPRWKVR